MGRTNFERFVQKVGQFIKDTAEEAASKQSKVKQPKLPPTQSVIEITIISRFNESTQKAINEEMENFYKNAPIPFVEIYETEIFKTSTLGLFYVYTSFSVLVDAPPRIARQEMEDRCHKIVETEEGILAFRAVVNRDYQ